MSTEMSTRPLRDCHNPQSLSTGWVSNLEDSAESNNIPEVSDCRSLIKRTMAAMRPERPASSTPIASSVVLEATFQIQEQTRASRDEGIMA